MRIPDSTLTSLRALPIAGVAARLGIKVGHTGQCLCPVHPDHHPSATVRGRHNRLRCFSCGASLDPPGLVQAVLGLSFVEACQWLLSDAAPASPDPSKGGENVRVNFDPTRYVRFFIRPFLSAAAQEWLTTQRIHPAVVRWCRLTSFRDREGIDWLQTPFYAEDGQTLIGVQNRRLTPSDTAPRFRFPSGSSLQLYGLHIVPRLSDSDTVWLCEGAHDVWSALSAGHKALGISSATGLTYAALQKLRELHNRLRLRYVAVPDNDEAGARLFRQLQQAFPDIGHIDVAPYKDYSLKYLSET